MQLPRSFVPRRSHEEIPQNFPGLQLPPPVQSNELSTGYRQNENEVKLYLNFIAKLSNFNFRDSDYITFFYEKKAFHALIKHRAYNFSDFLASVGGLIGLLAGASFISLIEILYFLLFNACKQILGVTTTAEIAPQSARTPQRKVVTAWREESVLHRFSDYFLEFLNKSSVHGVNHVVSGNHKAIGKSLWGIILLISLFTCGFLIKDNLKNSELNPVAFEVDEKLWNVEEVKDFRSLVRIRCKISD